MGDLFSTFNPNTEFLGICLSLNWLRIITLLLFIPSSYWILRSKINKSYSIVISLLTGELSSILRVLINPGKFLFLIRIFISVILINFLGLFPYIFTPTSHFSVTLRLSLPLWVGYIIIRFVKQIEINMAHLVPLGTPVLLIPLMVIIERVRLLIRPFTLAIRLAANIIAGHLLLVLLGSQGPLVGSGALIILILGLCLLITLECAVACIQRYVFMLLRCLYIREHSSIVINN